MAVSKDKKNQDESISKTETCRVYKSIQEYEEDTNYSSKKITRERFKETEPKTEMSSAQLRAATWKYLFICEPDKYALKSVIEEINNIHKISYDIVFILGDCNRVLMREISALFESALILQLPEEYFWRKDAKDFYITNFIGKRQRHGNKYIVGIGNGELEPIPDGDILVTTRNALEDKQILKYVKEKHPKLVFYLTNEPSNRKRLDDTIFVGCRGILPYNFNAVDVLGVSLEDLEELM